MSHHHFADLDELVLLCHDEKARAYLLEAVVSYKAGAMRAAIISTWIAVAFDFIDKVAQLDLQGDPAATQIATELKAIHSGNDLARSLAFERSILDRALNTLNLISASENEDLERLYKDRHRCAHPSMNAEGEIFQPTAEQVRYHIRTAVESLLSQPPTSGKAALESLVKQVEGEYFPTETSKAVTIFQKSVLAKPKPALVRNLVIVFIKKSLEKTGNQALRLRLAAAINALKIIQPEVCNKTISEKLSGLLRALPDDLYGPAIAIAARVQDASIYLEEDIKARMAQFITATPVANLIAVGSLPQDLPFLVATLSARIGQLSPADFILLMSNRVQLLQLAISKSRSIDVYKSATSFDQANSIAETLIIPLAKEFSNAQIQSIVRSSFGNSQVRGSFQFGDTMTQLRENPSVKSEWWDSLLFELGAQNQFANLFFTPPVSPFEQAIIDEEDIPF